MRAFSDVLSGTFTGFQLPGALQTPEPAFQMMSDWADAPAAMPASATSKTGAERAM